MIKLTRSNPPEKLTKEEQKKLTEEFKKDKKKSVWNKPYIRDALLKECNGKCIYCESLIGSGNKEMHVDHFHYKDKYVDEVVSWNNLNPSCPHCNKSKSTHDTYEDPIINPFEDNPQDYFYITNYRYRSKNKNVDHIVRNTINVLGLNDTDDLVKKRFDLCNALSDKIITIYDLAIEYQSTLSDNIPKRNRVLKGCKNLLKMCINTAEFSAFMATTIEEDDYYKKLKKLLQELNIWDEELDELDKSANKIKLATSRDN